MTFARGQSGKSFVLADFAGEGLGLQPCCPFYILLGPAYTSETLCKKKSFLTKHDPKYHVGWKLNGQKTYTSFCERVEQTG